MIWSLESLRSRHRHGLVIVCFLVSSQNFFLGSHVIVAWSRDFLGVCFIITLISLMLVPPSWLKHLLKFPLPKILHPTIYKFWENTDIQTIAVFNLFVYWYAWYYPHMSGTLFFFPHSFTFCFFRPIFNFTDYIPGQFKSDAYLF